MAVVVWWLWWQRLGGWMGCRSGDASDLAPGILDTTNWLNALSTSTCKEESEGWRGECRWGGGGRGALSGQRPIKGLTCLGTSAG